MIRQDFVDAFGFCIPCREMLDVCARLAPLVEVGAGTGYMTALLLQRGADCIATDPALSHQRQRGHRPLAPVLPFEAKTAVRRWPDRNVLVVWPGYKDTWARQMLKAMRVGRYVVAVTEGDGGCCADDGFFDALERCFVQDYEAMELPVFQGIHDYLAIWRKVRPWRRAGK